MSAIHPRPRRSIRLALGVVSIALILTIPSPSAAQPAAARPVNPKLHAILIFDTDDKTLKPYLGGNKKVLTQVFDQAFDRRMNRYGPPEVFEGERVEGAKVLKHIRKLKDNKEVRPEDTVFV